MRTLSSEERSDKLWMYALSDPLLSYCSSQHQNCSPGARCPPRRGCGGIEHSTLLISVGIGEKKEEKAINKGSKYLFCLLNVILDYFF